MSTYGHFEGINEHDLSVEIARCEGKLDEVNIAQIKETLRCTLEALGTYTPAQVMELVQRHATWVTPVTAETERLEPGSF